jgi:flagellar biogenesis protein FliO
MHAFRFLLGGVLCAYLNTTCAAVTEFRPEAETGVSLIAWGMVGLLALAGGVLVWIRRKGWPIGASGWTARRGSIQVLSGTPIGTGASLVEVRYHGRILLLGVTASGVDLIETNEDSLREKGSS